MIVYDGWGIQGAEHQTNNVLKGILTLNNDISQLVWNTRLSTVNMFLKKFIHISCTKKHSNLSEKTWGFIFKET